MAATVTTPNYTGSTTGTLVIGAAPVTVTLSGFSEVYNGNPQPVSAVTNPTGIPVTVTYNGSTTVPTSAGSYSVSASPTSSNYSGSASGTLVISQAAATFTLGNLTSVYNGSAQPVTVSVAPAGVAYSVKYNGALAAPATAGSYTVVVAITNPNYSGGATATLTIQQATPAVLWPQPAAITFGGALSATQLNATSTTPGTFLYSPAAGTVPLAGTQTLSALFSPTDGVDYAAVTATTTITVNPSNLQGTAITVSKALSRDQNNNIVLNATFANGGNVNASNLTVTVAKIGLTTAMTTLPISLGNLSAGSVVQTTITIPGSAGTTGSLATVTIGGTYTGGSFSTSGRAYLP